MVKVQDKTTGRFIGNKYVKIDGVWYKGKCSDCGKLLTSHRARRCMACTSLYKKGRPLGLQVHAAVSIAKTKPWSECGYGARHDKIKKLFGKACRCENKSCAGISSTYQWANKDHNYDMLPSSWIMLCVSCHKLYDSGKISL